ncbi:hypothetical protein ACM64Y_06815 [Novispirillum sp. DQ9]|uniref:hypothetical protein n=1 Tax=Novispirillum sp. DQ9 TaxID=3398612 RepID=UPI003C7C381B
MQPFITALAMALIVGTEATAAAAMIEGLIFWNRLDLLKSILWIAIIPGLVAGAAAGWAVLRWELAHREGSPSS